MIKYSVAITTYNARFETFFKPLIHQIKSARPDIEIIVAINGNHKESFDQAYRKNVLQFLSDYDNVFPTFFTEFRSLSKLWNTCLVNSSNHFVLMLNDDITIHQGFFDLLEMVVFNENYGGESFKMNGTWSHVFLNRQQINDIGFFDETLLGIGMEEEAEWRFNKFYNDVNAFKNLRISGLTNHISYENCIVNQEVVHGKYSKFNRERFSEIYDIVSAGSGWPTPWKDGTDLSRKDTFRNNCPTEKFYWDNKDKL